jgi:hypothetical protein
MFGELDRKARDAAGAALNEDRLAALKLERCLDGNDAVRPVSAIAAAWTCESASGFLAMIAALIASFSA